MGDYPSDCPEPRRNTDAITSSKIIQQTQGQYEAQVRQLCDTTDSNQADAEQSTAKWNGIHGWERQYH